MLRKCASHPKTGDWHDSVICYQRHQKCLRLCFCSFLWQRQQLLLITTRATTTITTTTPMFTTNATMLTALLQIQQQNAGLGLKLRLDQATDDKSPTRFRQGETAIIIARAEEISTGCLFEFTNREGQSCCYMSTLGRNLEDQDHLCVAGQEEEKEGEEFNCRDNSSFLVEEV